MKLLDFSLASIYKGFFAYSLVNLLWLPFAADKWDRFFLAAFSLFVGLVILGFEKSKK